MIRTNMWNRVTMTWECYSGGKHTSVCMDGNFDPTLHNPRVFSTKNDDKLHGLFGMESVSQHRDQRENGLRSGEMTLDIKCKGRNVAPNSEAIVKFLEAKLDKFTKIPKVCEYKIRIKPPQSVSWTDTKFLLSFILAQGIQFCDGSIEIARAVIEGLGIHDERGYFLANFSLKRETFAELDGSWITFARWLRITHRLPIIGPEDRA